MYKQNTNIKIIDRPCGTGKTTRLLKSFNENDKYIVVLPLLSEVNRVINEANVSFAQPTSEYLINKTDSLRDLLIEGKNIATTHSLYPNIVMMLRDGLLDDYHVIIDEVLEVVRSGKDIKRGSYNDIYIKGGYVVEDKITGHITPTKKWNDCVDDIDDTLSKTFYLEAKSGGLYNVDGTFFLWALPIEILTTNLSLTIYTYLARGSMLLAYLNKLHIRYDHDTDLVTDLAFRKKAKELITIKSIPAIEKMKLTATAQLNMSKKTKGKVATAIKNLVYRGELQGVQKCNIVFTSLKSNWYHNGKDKTKNAKGTGFSLNTGMLKAHWIANTTRGTNEFADTTHMVYLWDQHMNQYLRRWLGMDNNSHRANDAYAITELIQWVYRSQVRKGKPVTLYLPSLRMRKLLQSWLDAEDISNNF